MQIVEWYRVRWQIELVFKRLKSLANLGALPMRTDDSARAWLYGKLFVALLVEKLLRHARTFFFWALSPGYDAPAQRMA
jgi:IS4 transposase